MANTPNRAKIVLQIITQLVKLAGAIILIVKLLFK